LTDMLQIELVESVKEGFKKYNHKFM